MAPPAVQYPRATSLTAHSSRAAGVEVTGGSGGINPIGNVQPDRQDSTRSEGVDSSRSGVRLTAASIFVNAGAKKPLATPTGGGGAWPDNQPTRRATHQRPGAAGAEGAGGPGCGARGQWRRLTDNTLTTSPDRLEADAGPAGPGRASSRRAERSSWRGRLAGGQAARRPEIRRGHKRHQ